MAVDNNYGIVKFYFGTAAELALKSFTATDEGNLYFIEDERKIYRVTQTDTNTYTAIPYGGLTIIEVNGNPSNTSVVASPQVGALYIDTSSSDGAYRSVKYYDGTNWHTLVEDYATIAANVAREINESTSSGLIYINDTNISVQSGGAKGTFSPGSLADVLGELDEAISVASGDISAIAAYKNISDGTNTATASTNNGTIHFVGTEGINVVVANAASGDVDTVTFSVDESALNDEKVEVDITNATGSYLIPFVSQSNVGTPNKLSGNSFIKVQTAGQNGESSTLQAPKIANYANTARIESSQTTFGSTTTDSVLNDSYKVLVPTPTTNAAAANKKYVDDQVSGATSNSVVNVVKQATADTSYAATYYITQNGTQVGTKINIPKDFLVKSATLETCSTANVPEQGYVVGDKYLHFIINTQDNSGTNTAINIKVTELVDIYTLTETDSSTIDFTVNDTGYNWTITGGIKADSIDASHIKANAITSSELADGAVDTNAIINGNVTLAKLASGVQTSLGKADTAVQPATLTTALTWNAIE